MMPARSCEICGTTPKTTTLAVWKGVGLICSRCNRALTRAEAWLRKTLAAEHVTAALTDLAELVCEGAAIAEAAELLSGPWCDYCDRPGHELETCRLLARDVEEAAELGRELAERRP